MSVLSEPDSAEQPVEELVVEAVGDTDAGVVGTGAANPDSGRH